MSEQQQTPAAEAPATPIPLQQLEDLTEYRKRIAAGEDPFAEPVKPAEPEKPAEAAAETVEPEPEPDPASEAGKALAHKRKSLQDRIAEVTAERHRTAAERDAVKAEAAALRAELAALKAGKPAEQKPAEPEFVPDPADPEPDVNAFDSYEKYVKAQARWEARQEYRAERAKAEQEQRTRAIQTAQSTVERKAREAHPDFDEKIGAFVAGGAVFHPVEVEAILSHPNGHELAYALVTQPEARKAILEAQSPAAAYMAVGRVLASLEAAKPVEPEKPAPKPVSKAPAPVEPVAAAAQSGVPDPKTMNSLAEYRKYRKQLGG